MTKEQTMKVLGITADEYDQLQKDDKAIDRGEPMPFDLTAENAKIASKMAKIGTKTVKTAPKRAENAEKATIINQLYTFLLENVSKTAQITNKERIIAFSLGENRYELTLICKRKAKM